MYKNGVPYKGRDVYNCTAHVRAEKNSYAILWGHYSLQSAMEVKYDLIFEISDLNYICNPSFKVSLLVKTWLSREENENHDPLTPSRYRAAR